MESKRVEPTGNPEASIMFIGEAPGEKEVETGVPFSGLAGRMFDSLLDEVGLKRSEVYITNVMKVRPKGNDFSKFYVESKEGRKKVVKPSAELEMGYRELEEEIMRVRPNVIVPMGNEAMKAVLGFSGVLSYRGSVLESRLGKTVVCVHPAAILRQWTLRPATACDFARVKKEAQSNQMPELKRELMLGASVDEMLKELEHVKKAGLCAFDIETESNQVSCIGFASSCSRAVCVPFWFGSSGSLHNREDEIRLWEAIKDILEDEKVGKIGQNGMYDMEFLEHFYGIRTRNYVFDTQMAFHTLYPELPKGLDFLCSLYTYQPYYKYQRKTDDMYKHWEYNATDCVVTFECYKAIKDELAEAGLDGFYYDMVHGLIEPVMDMQRIGVRFNRDLMLAKRKEYKKRKDELQLELDRLVGFELNVGSPVQMLKWLYEDMKFTKKYKRRANGAKTLTSDEEALSELYVQTGNEALKVILGIRDVDKVLSTYLNIKLDEDKRIRCSYAIDGTETGRFSSSKMLRGTGANLQNIPEDLRDMFMADEGCWLINADYSQADARVVAYESGDVRLIQAFESGEDIHIMNAMNIFNVPKEGVDDDKRQLAKRGGHAANYMVKPRTLAKSLGISEKEAARFLGMYFATYPRVQLWHMNMQKELKSSRRVVNPFGRVRLFFDRWSDAMLREALAFIPQSTVADGINRTIKMAYKRFSDESIEANILLQVHDSVVVQAKQHCVMQACRVLKEIMMMPITIKGRDMVIPCDFKIGKNWKDMQKIKIN